MPKTITFESRTELRIVCEADGTPVSGAVHYRGSNGSIESVSIGGAGGDVAFGSIGTAAQRTAFRAMVAGIVAAGRTVIGDV